MTTTKFEPGWCYSAQISREQKKDKALLRAASAVSGAWDCMAVAEEVSKSRCWSGQPHMAAAQEGHPEETYNQREKVASILRGGIGRCMSGRSALGSKWEHRCLLKDRAGWQWVVKEGSCWGLTACDIYVLEKVAAGVCSREAAMENTRFM